MGKSKQRLQSSGSAGTLWQPTDLHAILFMIAASAFFFRDIIFQQAYYWEDFLYYFFPVRNLAAVSLAGGQLPLWNPYTFCGMPFQADIQTALFYIPNLLLTLFVSNGHLNFYWVEIQIILHYALAGVTMYFLAKEFGIEPLFAVFSGMAFMLSGFMIMHAIHQVVICQIAWFPLVVLLFHRALHRKSLLHMIAGGLVLGHSVLAGYPQVTLYIFFFLLLYFLAELAFSVSSNGWKSSLPLVLIGGGFILFALGITGVQLLPTIELAPLSQRAEITYQKSLEGSLSWERLVTLVVPKFFGVSNSQGTTFWLPKPYWEYWETCVYVGIAVLVLSIFAFTRIRKHRTVAFFSAVALFALIYSLGDNGLLHKFFFSVVPGFSKFRNPARMSLLLAFSLSLLAGFGLQEVAALVSSRSKRFLTVIGSVAGAGILLRIAIAGGALQPSNNAQFLQQFQPVISSEATTAFVLILIVAAILFLWYRSSVSATVAVLALLFLQFVDIHIFGFNQNNSSQNPQGYFEQTKQLVDRVKEEGAQEYFRVNSRSGSAMILDRNQGMIDRICLVEGYTPLALQRIYPPAKDWQQACDRMNAKIHTVVDERTHAAHIGISTTYSPRVYCVFRDTILPQDADMKAFMEGDRYQPDSTAVLEAPLNEKLDGSGKGSATITSYLMNSMSVDVIADKNCFLVFAEVYYPGWNAYIDGVHAPLLRTNWCMRGVPVPSGNHRVELRFEPDSFRNGLWITMITTVLAAAGIVYSSRKNRPVAPPIT